MTQADQSPTRHPDLQPAKVLRLAVSGDVALTRLELRILDTVDYQRLRQIRQLGTAYLVYPTALHTRFDHSLGVLDLTTRMIEAIRANDQSAPEEREITPEQEQLARLYALLHDITHIPFGHTLEDEFCLLPRHDSNTWRIERFLGEASPIGRLLFEGLGRELYSRLMALVRSGQTGREALGEDDFILDLVDDTICADLLDYLRRDAFFCNVALEAEYRFLRHLALDWHEGRRRMVVRLWKEGKATPRRDVLSELVRLLDNRYLMSERVYYHHAKLVTGSMVAAAVGRALRAGELDEAALCELGDETLLWRLRQSGEPAVRRLAESLASRHPWKLVYEKSRDFILAEQQAARQVDVLGELMDRYHADAGHRMGQEERLAGLLGLAAGDIIFYCPHLAMAMKPAGVLVLWNGALRPLADCSDDALLGAKLRSILDSHQNLWGLRIFLNPDALNRRDEVAEAVEGLFIWEPARAKRFATRFYGELLKRKARSEALGTRLPATEWDQRQAVALDMMLERPEPERTCALARKALAKAFGDHETGAK